MIKISDYTDTAAWRSALWNGKVIIFFESEGGTNAAIRAALIHHSYGYQGQGAQQRRRCRLLGRKL